MIPRIALSVQGPHPAVRASVSVLSGAASKQSAKLEFGLHSQ